MEKPLHVEESLKQRSREVIVDNIRDNHGLYDNHHFQNHNEIKQLMEEHQQSREVKIDDDDEMVDMMIITMEMMIMIMIMEMIIILRMIINFATTALFTRFTRTETRHQANFRW